MAVVAAIVGGSVLGVDFTAVAGVLTALAALIAVLRQPVAPSASSPGADACSGSAHRHRCDSASETGDETRGA